MSSEQVVVSASVDIELSKERKKPRLLALLFCDFASIAKDDKINLLGTFDKIYVDPEKRTTPMFVVYVRVAEVSEAFAITVFGPDDLPTLQMFSVPPSAFTEGLPRQVQTIIRFQFKLEKEGTYWFDISYQGSSLGGAGLPIEYRPGKEQESGTESYV